MIAKRDAASPSDPGVFRRWKTRDGLLVEGPSDAVNLAFVGLGAFAWLHLPLGQADKGLHSLLTALAKQRGIQLGPSTEVVQDNRLQGWPWVPDTFSWVEPTAWCLLAMKRWNASGKAPSVAQSRIREGEGVLADRALAGGGWNYGNPLVYGKVLQPFVPTTALALLALRDEPRRTQVVDGLEWLRAHRLSELSASGLAWAAIGLRAFGADVSDLRDRLLAYVEPGLVDSHVAVAAQVAEALAVQAEGDPFAL